MAPPSYLKTLVLDNGADRLKIGYAGESTPRYSIPNCTAKLKGQVHSLVGDEIELVNNTANLQYSRPFDRGYVNNWDSEYQVWKRIFGEHKMKVDAEETQLILTEAPFTPPTLSAYATQVVFEEFGFAACAKLPASSLSAYHYESERINKMIKTPFGLEGCALVVDSGFSFTHIVPYYKGRVVREGVKRINVGGKFLTNLLKETVSYRQWNMMDEFQLMNDAKEALCYVSQNFEAEMALLRPGGGGRKAQGIRRHFVLPDFQTTMKGYVQEEGPHYSNNNNKKKTEEGDDQAQVLSMEVERFVVPEVLFRPLDVGLRQAGLSEAIIQSVEDCDVGIRHALYSNILLTGGNVKLRGLADRLNQEVRSLIPDHYPVNIYSPSDPLHYAWIGGAKIARDPNVLDSLTITRSQYEEHGVERCNLMMNEKVYL